MSKKVDKKWTETHFYDNNISKSIIESIQPLLIKSGTVSKEDKLVIFDDIRTLLTEIKTNEIGMKYYDQIIQSFMKDGEGNYDSTNKLDAIDLLYVICMLSVHMNNDSMLLLLKEQLEDLQSGFCPQGRTIRFMQIISSFMSK